MSGYSFGGIQQNTEVRVKHFLLTQSGSYQEQNLRPFKTHVTGPMVDKLASATMGGVNLGIMAVQNVANEVIRPAAVPEGVVGINNGWISRRFRFLMHIVENHPFNAGEITNRILFGYTDNCDVSHGHLLDPEMRIYFNSETVITESVRPTLNGPVRQAVVSGSNQIISPVNYQTPQITSGNLYNAAHSHLIRPEDVFSMGQTVHVAASAAASGAFPDGIQAHIDNRTMVPNGGEYKYSMRRDTSPSRYLSDTLGAFQHAIKEEAMSNSFGDNEPLNMGLVYGEAYNAAANQDIQSNTFLGRLKDYVNYMQKGYVTYRELCQMFPEAERNDVTRASMDTGQSIRRVNHAEHSMHWNGSEPITIAASLLAQVIPAIMMDNFIRTVSFAVTNGYGRNSYNYEVHAKNARMLVTSLDQIKYLTEFQRRLFVDILHTITHGNQIPFNLTVFADLGEDTVIDIALGNEPTRRYVAPTFTDSLFSPMITRNDKAMTDVSKDLIYLVGQVIPTPSVANNVPSFTPQQPMANLHMSTKPAVSYQDDYGLL